MTDELFTRRVLREVTRAGKPVTCEAVSIALREQAADVRYALQELVGDGDVIEVHGLYERAHGGYLPPGGSAA